jgi:hypothetical protein
MADGGWWMADLKIQADCILDNCHLIGWRMAVGGWLTENTN